MAKNTNNLQYEDSKFHIENAVLNRVDGTIPDGGTTPAVMLDADFKVNGKFDNGGVIQETIDNSEYLQVTTDSENKILEGITSEGKKQVNIPINTPSATIEHTENPEFLSVTTDSEERVLYGIKENGSNSQNINNSLLSLDDLICSAGNKITIGGDYYLINSDFVYELKINPTIQPLLFGLLCCSNNNASIAVEYINPAYYKYKVKCVNDYVVENDTYKYVQILLPPFVYDNGYVRFTFKSGLRFKQAVLTETHKEKPNNNLIFLGHLGAFLGWNNVNSFEMAATLGLEGCVANVMTTLDGVLVCSHDNQWLSQDGNMYAISEKTLAEINELGFCESSRLWGYNNTWRQFFNDTKIATVDKFLEICHLRGLIPTFSIDVNYLPDWSELNSLLIKYGFTKSSSFYLKIKGETGNIHENDFLSAYEVFGNRAVYIASGGKQYQTNLNQLIGLNLGDSLKYFEAWSIMSDSLIEQALAANIGVAIYESILEDESVQFPYLTSKEIREYIRKGVTMFTTDGFFNNGLNW